jgi:hypothetical protein
MNGSFEVASCHYAFNLRGAVEGSRVLTPAKNGTAAQPNSYDNKPTERLNALRVLALPL